MLASRHARLALSVLLTGFAACSERTSTLAEPELPAFAASAAACSARANNNDGKLTECVTLQGVRAHLVALQAIADANGGTRHTGSPGYDASATYVADLLRNAGYSVTLQPFSFSASIQTAPTVLQQTAPFAATYADLVDHRVLAYSATGSATANVTAVDYSPFTPINSITSGCDASDFAGFPVGNIALVQRGGCSFQLKALNAQAAGASAVIVGNNVAGLFGGTLGSNYTGTLPVVGVTKALGDQFSVQGSLTMTVNVTMQNGTVATNNVIAESADGDAGNVVMAGAPLDAAPMSPGINNASGAATLLETALQMARVKPRNRVRFAFWAASQGILGSATYVASLSAAQRSDIAMYLNFDRVASPNFARFVIDGTSNAFNPLPTAGAGVVQNFLSSLYLARGLTSELLAGPSDATNFRAAGITDGGINAGSFALKTPQQAAAYGGVPDVPFDPCANLPCDVLNNLNLALLDVNSDVVATAIISYAMNTSSVNGVKGKGGF